MNNRKICIIGLGNVLLKDEGFGIHLIKYLQKEGLEESIELIDGGTLGFNLIDFISDSSAIIFIDVINTDARPGRIYRFDNKSFQILNMKDSMSLHQIGLVDILHLSEMMNKHIKIIILAIVPKEISWGMELTPLLERKIPKMAELVKKEINNL